jgi:hypothetical protein
LTKPNLKTTDWKVHPGYFAKGLHVDGQPAGVIPQYQRAEVIPGGDCETVGDFTEELSGSFDVAAVGAGRVGSNAIRLTQTVAAGDRCVYLLLSQAVDLRWARYIGFWYRGGNSDAFTEGDIELYIFTSPTSYLRASAFLREDLFPGNFTEEAAAVWHYAEFAISGFTEVPANRNAALREVWGIGFYSDAGTNGNALDIDQIEFYTHPTGYGAARGTLLSAPIADGVTLAVGYGVAWDIGSGRVSISGNNERDWAGICVEGGTGNEAGTVFAVFVVDGPVNMLCDDASIAAGEGVSCSAAGTALTVDDGGGSSQGIMIGKSLETGATNAVITVLLGVPGTSA